MKQLSFKTQVYLSLAIMGFAFLLGQIFRMGVFHNIGCILVGLLFVINPVWPKMWDWREHHALKTGTRIGGILVIVIFGFLTRFGV